MKRITQKSLKTLERLESSYRLIYTVIMGAPLLVSLENLLINPLKDTNSFKSFKGISNISLTNIFIYLIFISIYTRFYLGDLRYLDLKYLESQQSTAYKQRYSPISRFLDFCSLIFHAILFFALATSINQFNNFTEIYTGILALNAIWLGVVYLTTDRDNRKRIEVKSTLFWTLNNAFCVMLLLFYHQRIGSMSHVQSLVTFMVIAVFNGIVDYVSAWRLYFPNIQEELIENN